MIFLKIVSVSITLLLVTLLALNFSDVSENPKVSEILKMQNRATEAQQSAFFYVLGLHADPTLTPRAATDPEQAGRELWFKFSALPTPQRKEFWQTHIAKKPVWTETPITCPGAPLGLCTTAFIKTHPLVIEFLKRDPEVLKKYTRLMEYGAGINLFYGDDQILFSRLWVVSPGLHRQFLLQLANWSLNGDPRRTLHELELSSRYLHDILLNGNLFERMVAAQELAQNAAFLKAELEVHPKLKVTTGLMKSLAPPPAEEVLSQALVREVQFASHVIVNFGAHPVTRLLRPLTFQPTKTLNQFYEQNLSELSDVKDTELATPWNWLENPLGRSLLKRFALHFKQRKPRLEESLKHLQQDQLKISERL